RRAQRASLGGESGCGLWGRFRPEELDSRSRFHQEAESQDQARARLARGSQGAAGRPAAQQEKSRLVASYRVGVDVGGTFTDIVLLGADGTIHTKKISSST